MGWRNCLHVDGIKLVTNVSDATNPLLQRTVGSHVRGWHGGAHLSLMPGRIVLTPGRVLRSLTGVEEIIHTKPRVLLLRTVLAPPWMSTHVIVEGSDATGTASASIFGTRRLREALMEAGFRVEEIRKVFSLGGQFVR